MPTIDEIRTRFDEARAAIGTLDQELAAERSEIRLTAFRDGRRPLKPREVARRKEIAATRTELADALEVLAENTVSMIESEGLEDVIHELKSVNSSLEDDLNRLRQLKDHAESAAGVAAGLAGLVDGLIGLRPPTA